MSKDSQNRKPRKGEEVDPAARRKQVIVGVLIGGVVGLVLSILGQFWLWLPAGLAMGLATGFIMKPPSE